MISITVIIKTELKYRTIKCKVKLKEKRFFPNEYEHTETVQDGY